MSRSQYTDECGDDSWWPYIRWRGQVASSIRGKRGQKLLCDLRDALDAMPSKRLIAHELEDEKGEHCALGVLGKVRGIDMRSIDPEEPEQVASAFDVAEPLVQEIVFENDEQYSSSDFTPEKRWRYMRDWVEGKIKYAEKIRIIQCMTSKLIHRYA